VWGLGPFCPRATSANQITSSRGDVDRSRPQTPRAINNKSPTGTKAIESFQAFEPSSGSNRIISGVQIASNGMGGAETTVLSSCFPGGIVSERVHMAYINSNTSPASLSAAQIFPTLSDPTIRSTFHQSHLETKALTSPASPSASIHLTISE